MARAPFKELEKKLGHGFKDQALLKAALTHSSSGDDANYERLEFLGDRVLGLAIAEMLYEKFPKEAEGDLAKRLAALAQGELLAEIATEIDLGSHIIMSAAETQAGGARNENILSDVFEALIGAMYLDSGYKKCRALIEKLWATRFHEMKTPPQHPKTALQEWAQAKGLSLPVYKIIKQHGPDHAPIFDVELSVNGHPSVMASGQSRQEAEKQAAQAFMESLGKK